MDHKENNVPLEDTSGMPPLATPVSEPARGIEWGALCAGCAVGVVWWFLQRILYGVAFRALLARDPSIISSPWFNWIAGGMSVCFALVQGTIIGFVVALCARHSPYRFTVITTVLVVIVNILYLVLMMYRYGGWAAQNLFWIIAYPLFSLLGALNGAYLTLSYKRNRNVRIT